jgi:hypothetical protein
MRTHHTLFVTVVCVLLTQLSYSQTPAFDWAKKLGSPGSFNQGNALAIDQLGNIYTTGQFESTSDFDPGTGTFDLTSAGIDDVYISKLDSDGNFVWAKRIGSTGFDEGWGIAVDLTGNVYISGHYQNTVDFDPGAGVSNHTASGGDIFIIKLDTNGNFVWGVSMGSAGIGDEYGYGITTDASGNVYTTGVFTSIVDFNPGAGIFNLTSAGNYDVFISKLDTDGNFIWAKQLGGTQSDNGRSIALDGSGNIYTSGYFRGTADFDPGAATFNITSTSVFYDVFVSKLDPSGNFVWAKNMGGAEDDLAQSIAIDPTGNVYTTGYFFATADFDPGAATFNLTAAGSSADIFISKLDASGNFLWAKSFGNANPYPCFGRAITTDGSGNVYATGAFEGTIDFDPGASIFELKTAADDDIFILKLSPAGNFIWAGSMGYVDNDDDSGRAIKVDASGNIYTTGDYRAINASGNTDFDPGSCVFNLSGQAAFIQKLSAATSASHTITNFSPTSGTTGTSVTINGTNFSTTPANNVVAFNGTSATVTASTTTTITTSVPAAATTGPISVTIGCNTVTSASNFTISSVLPTITNFTPSSGPVSTVVTITGTNFSATAANNTVRFNGTLAIASASTTTSITATVPAGATTGPITVTVSGNTATSASNFTVTTGSITFTTQPSDRSICGITNTTFAVAATGDTGLQYQWQIDDGGFEDLSNNSTYSGVTTPTLSISNPPLSLNGSVYRCVVSGNNSGDTPSQSASLTINTFPVASISLDGTLLVASDGDSFQWYRNGVEIPGATLQTLEFNALEQGVYVVDVTENGCTTTSDDFIYLITGSEDMLGHFKLYPNPVKNVLHVDAPEKIRMEISDIAGKQILISDIYGNKTLPMNHLTPGIYIIKVMGSDEIKVIRVFKE